MLVNTGDTFDDAYEFVGEAGVTLPVLLDADNEVYDSYNRFEAEKGYAPYPLQILIDEDGVIRYLNNQYDASAVRAEIDALLAE